MHVNRLYTLFTLLVLLAVPSLSWSADEQAESNAAVSGYVSLGDPMVLNLSSGNRKLSFLRSSKGREPTPPVPGR